MRMSRRIVFGMLAILMVLGALAGIGRWVTKETDIGQVWYKRMKAPSPYVFDEIPDEMLHTEPASLIAGLAEGDGDRLRRRINAVVWGEENLPSRQPATVERGMEPPDLAGLAGISETVRLVIPFEFDYTAHAYVLMPDTPNGRAVIYQHGYAGTVGKSQHVIQALVDEGFVVAALDFAGYGENLIDNIDHPRFGAVPAANDRQMYFVNRPLRWYLEPMVVTVNHLESAGYTDISSVGFSAGGWVTTMVGALDTRITRTVAVASGYPLYIRSVNWERETPLPQMYKPLLDVTNYLNLYLLASIGDGRKYLQLFNQYDRCCYRNRFSELYTPALQDAVDTFGAGEFSTAIDVTHADHKISDWGLGRIFSELSE